MCGRPEFAEPERRSDKGALEYKSRRDEMAPKVLKSKYRIPAIVSAGISPMTETGHGKRALSHFA